MTEGLLDNLKVSMKDGKPCEKVLSIEVYEDEIKKEFDLFYHAVAPQAKVPGFRPGKAPRHVLEMHYKDEAHERVLKNLISESFKQALQSQALEPLGYPKIDDINFTDDKLSYKASVEIRPKIKLNKFRGLSVKREKPEIKAEEIDHELKHIQESLAQFKAVEDRPSQMGDFVIADYVCTVENKEIDKRNGDWLELKEDEFLKGFSAQLVGMKPGDEKTVQVTFPEKMGRPELAGKPGQFQVKVKEIKLKNLPPLNDELAKTAGEYKTLDELKEKIKKDLVASKEKQIEVAYENALMDELVHHNKIDLPSGLVQKRGERLLEEAKQKFLQQGYTEEDFEKQKNKLTPELESEAKRQIHVAFLLDEIAGKENIVVTDEDRKRKYQQIADRVRQPLESVEKYYAENEDAKDSIYEQLRSEKAVQFIKDNAKPK